MGTQESICNCIYSKEQNGIEEKVDNNNSTQGLYAIKHNNTPGDNNEFYIHDNDNIFIRPKHSSKFSSLSKSKIYDIAFVQAVFRGFSFRKLFKRLKTQLINLTIKKIECLQMRFNNVTITQAEEQQGKFDYLKWKKYYPNEKAYLFEYNISKYGKLYECKLLTYQDISYYIGSVNVKYQRCGIGSLIDISGMKYEGMWGGEKLNGWGRVIESDGTIYEGYYIDNFLNGKGEKISLDGTIFKGDFVNGLMNGKGYEETIDHIYQGDFYNDTKEGQGKLQYKKKKDRYEGQFQNNSINGIGTYTWENGDNYTGTFQQGKMDGRGRYLWAEGDEYEGDYIDGIKEGNGIFKWNNGKIYSGTFEGGKPHGVGVFYCNKKKYDVEFSEGKIVKSNELSSSGIITE